MNYMSYLALAVVLSLPLSAQAGTISINFQGNGGTSGLVGSSETAGFIPVNNWNDKTSTGASTPSALVDNLGNATTATVSYTGGSNGNTVVPVSPLGVGDIAMIRGNIFSSSSTPVSVSVGGTIPYAQYDIYVYLNGNVSNNLQNISILDSGSNLIQTKQALQSNNTADNAYTLSTSTADGNYIVFSGLDNTTLPNFLLTSVRETGSTYGYINGIQIHDTTPPVVPVPEPTTSVMLGLGGLMLCGAGRRRRRAARDVVGA